LPQLLLRYEDLVELGVVRNRQTLANRIARDRFPAPIQLGDNTRAWLAFEVFEWLAGRPRVRPCEVPSAPGPAEVRDLRDKLLKEAFPDVGHNGGQPLTDR